MREIKFRIIFRNKVFAYERLAKSGWEWMCLDLNPDKGERWTSGVLPENKEYKREQFTGLKDKNGKEIYEGDIIKYTHHGGYNLQSNTSRVVWSEDRAAFCYIQKYELGDLTTPFSDHHELDIDFLPFTEVIGNVFEYPELINTP